MNLILASGSPRRRELLERIGLNFTVQVADADETLLPNLDPKDQVIRLSQIKARAVAEEINCPEDAVILAADTVVVLEGEILGKPRDETHAKEMLAALSGRDHQVLTGITVRRGQRVVSHCEETAVHFRPLTQGEIDAYVATKEPMDKAGAYGIQGYAALFVDKLNGDYYNVMGLPVCAAAMLLRDFGLPLLEATP